MNEDEEEKKKEVEVITGDSSELDISPVYDHIKIDKPEKNSENKKDIVIPKSKNDKN